MRAASERDFGTPNADANGAAAGATLLSAPTDHLMAPGLPNDATGQNVNRPNQMSGLSLNPSTPTFQPTDGDLLSDAVNASQAGLERPPGPGLMSVQQYKVLLDLNYVANKQWEKEEMQQQIDQLRAEQIHGQQALHGSAQTLRMHEPLLQNCTAIGALNDDARQPGLVTHSQHSIYTPITELADKRQMAACSNLALLNPHMPLGTCVRTNVPPSQLQDIDVTTATLMRKVHIRQFDVMTCQWNQWQHDFEVAMKGADIPQSRWVAVLPSHLDDLSRDVYKEITMLG